SLKEGLLGDASNVRASRIKTGPFDPVRSYPEFRDLVVGPSALEITPSGIAARRTPLPAQPLPRPQTPVSAIPFPEEQHAAPLETTPVQQESHDGLLWFVILLLVALFTAFAGYVWFLPPTK